MISFPNAKINLGLNIVSKRSDGYHNLETIFYPIAIKDALEVVVTGKTCNDVFVENGLKIDSEPENNLVMKALKLMRQQYGFPVVEVHLLKKIPFGAGLGGGSADASFMFKLLNDKFTLGATDAELADMALQLGADCPFFIYNKPMFASGVGEVFEDVNLSLKNYYVVLVKPDIHVSTKDAFALVKPKQPQISLKEIIFKPIEEWKNCMVNDFEESVFAQFPTISDIKRELYEIGALYASMSGSGSSVFGIFKEPPYIDESIFKNCFIWQGNGI